MQRTALPFVIFRALKRPLLYSLSGVALFALFSPQRASAQSYVRRSIPTIAPYTHTIPLSVGSHTIETRPPLDPESSV